MPQQLAGITHVGSSENWKELVKVAFATPFDGPPVVVASVLLEDSDNAVRFGTVIMETRPDGFTAQVGMINGHKGWGRDVRLCWIATQAT